MGRGVFFGVGLVQASKEGREERGEEYSLVLGSTLCVPCVCVPSGLGVS